MPDGLTDLFPITEDVDYEYKMLRQDGKSRESTIQQILEDNADYLSDSDDGPQVWIGLAKAMARKKELTAEILTKAEAAFDALCKLFPGEIKLLTRYKSRICDHTQTGPEARYIKRKEYDPNWNIGDTFLYRLQSPIANKAGMINWVVILRKTGNWIDRQHHLNHIFYLSVCPPNLIPSSDKELNSLGYLPFQPKYTRNEKKYYEFQWSIYLSCKKQQERYCLEYLGNFPTIVKPSCEAEYNEYFLANPLFPINSKGLSSIEFYGIFWYRRYGLLQ